MTLRPYDIFEANDWIGRSASAADPYFDGHIDDFRIYNRPLSYPEIMDLYRVR